MARDSPRDACSERGSTVANSSLAHVDVRHHWLIAGHTMQVDLPSFILVHAVGLVALGCKMLFLDRPSAAPLGVATSAIGFCCELLMRLLQGLLE